MVHSMSPVVVVVKPSLTWDCLAMDMLAHIITRGKDHTALVIVMVAGDTPVETCILAKALARPTCTFVA